MTRPLPPALLPAHRGQGHGGEAAGVGRVTDGYGAWVQPPVVALLAALCEPSRAEAEGSVGMPSCHGLVVLWHTTPCGGAPRCLVYVIKGSSSEGALVCHRVMVSSSYGTPPPMVAFITAP
jgi:hypothetical protein